MEYYTISPNLERVTLDDCLELYNRKNICTSINDGSVVCFIKDE